MKEPKEPKTQLLTEADCAREFPTAYSVAKLKTLPEQLQLTDTEQIALLVLPALATGQPNMYPEILWRTAFNIAEAFFAARERRAAAAKLAAANTLPPQTSQTAQTP